MASALYQGNEVVFTEYIVKSDAYALFAADGSWIKTLNRLEYLDQPQLHTIGNSNGRYRRTSSSLYSNPVGQSSGAVPVGASIHSGSFVAITAALTTALTNSEYRAIPEAGIRAGEVIARRCWQVRNSNLFSVYMMDYQWYPNYPATGDVSDGFGVHAFKWDYDLGLYMSDHQSAHYFLISGTVSLWGEIAEHERGYRAEYAKILSLDTHDLYLKRKYGV